MGKKYKLLAPEKISIGNFEITARRIQALKDIPEKEVKAGDIGGWVEWVEEGFRERMLTRQILSQKGTCWIGGNAIVMRRIRIKDDVLVTGNALVKPIAEDLSKFTSDKYAETKLYGYGMIKENAIIKDNAIVSLTDVKNTSYISIIKGNPIIKDNSKVSLINGACLSGNTIVSGKAAVIATRNINIRDSIFSDDSYYESTGRYWSETGGYDLKLSGYARVSSQPGVDMKLSGCSFSGDASVIGQGVIDGAVVTTGNHFSFSQFTYDTMKAQNSKGESSAVLENSITSTQIHSTIFSDLQSYKDQLHSLDEEFNAYKHDIIRLIKYPMMADLSNPDILNFVHSFKLAKRLCERVDMKKLPDAVANAEKLFLVAESKARTALDINVDIQGQSKLKKAKKLLAIAHNEGSSENEKKISCERVLKELKGIIPLEDKLVNNLRISVGLKELEM